MTALSARHEISIIVDRQNILIVLFMQSGEIVSPQSCHRQSFLGENLCKSIPNMASQSRL